MTPSLFFSGVDLSADKIADLLSKMSLPSKALDGKRVEVEVGPTRHDILHPCDIMEVHTNCCVAIECSLGTHFAGCCKCASFQDVAIAYGYNNIVKTMPKSMTIATQQPMNKLTDLLRTSLSQSGFTEALTFSLCSRDDISSRLRLKPADALADAVHISNPKTLEFQVKEALLSRLKFGNNSQLHRVNGIYTYNCTTALFFFCFVHKKIQTDVNKQVS